MKQGDKVILHMFTGVSIALKEIVKETSGSFVIKDNNGNDLVFDKNTLKQIKPAPKKDRFANYITEDDGSFVPKPKKEKKPKKVIPKKEVIEEDDWEEDDYIEV